ncbi:hypothetical protein [Streptomyces sp. NPDC058954]|uniref:hypothetical protein n=1 Tax=Streptomyces sp. NPDC058954 TaxID=3346677 RepID=UPI0036C08583
MGAGVRAGLGPRPGGCPALLQPQPLHDVVRAWQARLEAAPAVREFLAGGRDDSDGVDLADALDGGR